jgi:four helix bundle protein
MNEGQKYRKLLIYEKATALVVHVYALIKKFPKEEQYALCDQLRRAAVSIPSNIAEGAGRVSKKERAHFIEIAYASMLEANCQLDIACDLEYINQKELEEITNQLDRVASLISGLRAKRLERG